MDEVGLVCKQVTQGPTSLPAPGHRCFKASSLAESPVGRYVNDFGWFMPSNMSHFRTS